MLEFKNVSKEFGPVKALSDINFRVEKGEIVGLVGENGAGKSTLMKIIFGAYQADSGTILIDGRQTQFGSPRDAMQNGIGMVFQEQSLIGNLSIMENLFLGREAEFRSFGMIDFKKMAHAAKHQLEKVGLDIDPKVETSTLSFSQRQLIELAKVLTLEERTDKNLVILLDEPTSVLSEDEVELLFSLVNKLRERAAFIFVSHRLDEVIKLSDRIYVLKDGEVVDEVDARSAEPTKIQAKMVGREIQSGYYMQDERKPFSTTNPILSVAGLCRGNSLKSVSFDVFSSQVICLVGTEGSGREAILRSIFAMDKPEMGTITYYDDPKLKIANPYDAVRNGVGYMPRERKIEGIFSSMSVAENMTSSQLDRYSKNGFLRKSHEQVLAKEWVHKLSIKTPSIHSDCGRLSGGNQQKVVLAKWRSSGAKLIMLDHPTRGLDIGAKQDVYAMIREMSGAGIGLIVVPDTFEEAIGLAHTILVMKDGACVKSFDAMLQNVTPFDLVAAMT